MWTTNRRDGGRWGTWLGLVPAARAAGVAVRPDTSAVRLVFDGARCTGAEVTATETAGPGSSRSEATEVIRAGPGDRLRGARTAHPSCCCGPASVPSRCSRRSGSRRYRSSPASAPMSRTTPGACFSVDVTDAALIEVPPVSGALLRYELADPDAEHVEAEIFPWQLRPYDRASPPTRVAFTAARAGEVSIRTSGKESPDSGYVLSREPQKASGFGPESGLGGLESYSTLKLVSFVGA